MPCSLAVISWPIANKTPDRGFICLGRIYDRKVLDDSAKLTLLHRDLSYLYPFWCSSQSGVITCHNSEDFNALRARHKLTYVIEVSGLTGSHIFHTPVLFDTDCMVPVFRPFRRPRILSFLDRRICLVMPYTDPVDRGRLLTATLETKSAVFLLMGGLVGKNKTSIATLAVRFLLSCGVQHERLIKCKKNIRTYDPIFTKQQYLLTGLNVLQENNLYDGCEITIACLSEDINLILFTLKDWRRCQLLEKARKFRFCCP